MVGRIAFWKLFGFAKCDTLLPNNLDHIIKEMCPIFKNTCLGRDGLSEHMRVYNVETGGLKQPQHTLIRSKCGENILLTTALFKY